MCGKEKFSFNFSVFLWKEKFSFQFSKMHMIKYCKDFLWLWEKIYKCRKTCSSYLSFCYTLLSSSFSSIAIKWLWMKWDSYSCGRKSVVFHLRILWNQQPWLFFKVLVSFNELEMIKTFRLFEKVELWGLFELLPQSVSLEQLKFLMVFINKFTLSGYFSWWILRIIHIF